jgi:energy-coupling factor transport system ATP-binding protein
VLGLTERALFVDGGRLLLDATRDEALAWLGCHRPAYVPMEGVNGGPASAAAEPVVALDRVSFAYRAMPVLDGISLSVGRGEVVVLEGPNGSGKTTLAKIAAGLLPAAAGEVQLAGRVAYLAQDPGRYVVSERVEQEVALGVSGDTRRAQRALASVGLGWAAARHPRDLSTGERERLALAAVAVGEADLLVLDEPTRGVDPERRLDLFAWVRAYASKGRGVLVVTHDRGFPADRRVSLGTEEVALVAG